MKAPRFRTLFRFSVRTLLLVITAIAVWLGLYVHRARVQNASVQAIEEYGGWVRYDFQFPSGRFEEMDFDAQAESPVPQWILDRLGIDFFHSVVQVTLNFCEDSGSREENHNPSDDALGYLPGFPSLRVLLLSDTQASDTGMQHLANLKKLERVMMWDACDLSDDGVSHVKNLKNLKCIHISASQITDKSLRVFADMPKLETLSLQFNYFTDEGMKHAGQLRHLETLYVCGRRDRVNPITDAGLEELEALKKLNNLGIQFTQVTDAGIESFKLQHPGCQITR